MLRHPIDTAISEYLRTVPLKQKDLAARIGRSAGWVSKFLSGTGHATIDDLIRIAAVVMEIEGLSAEEWRLVKACRRIEKADHPRVAKFFETWARQEVQAARKRGSTVRSR
jgi:transcriptional regulator with XRE-family HTH domain